MLIDIAQRKDFIEVSHSTPTGGIDIKNIPIRAFSPEGIYDYIVCSEDDPDKVEGLIHYKTGEAVKKICAVKFDFDELREFLLKRIPENIRKDIYAMNSLYTYMVDIEINTEDGDVFPSPTKADFPIDSIQITDGDLNTYVLTCNKRVVESEEQMSAVEDAINAHYKDIAFIWTKTKRLKYVHKKFDSEREMLVYWWNAVRESLHSVSFWNGLGFDVPYLMNRSKKLGIDPAVASPVNEIGTFTNWPKHRYMFDYMRLVQHSAGSDVDRTSFALDHIATEIAGVGKISKGGSYKDLYTGDIVKFLTYGAVDTISMQLIHLMKKYTTAKESLVYYCKTALVDADHVTTLCHALIWDELYKNGQINAEPHVKADKIPYGGGYVKEPTQMYVQWVMLNDFSALYPRIMQTLNVSFDNYVKNEPDEAERQKLIDEGYIVTVNNNVYRNDKDYTLKTIETALLGARYEYKNMQMIVYQEAMTLLDEELKKRGLKH